MHPRGVFFTFLTFLLIGVILSLLLFSSDSNQRFSETTVEISVLNAINTKYDDITDDIITLDHSIGIPGIQQRILPFSYTEDGNTLTITQTLPIASGKLALYFDLINAYKIFVEDTNTQSTFDGVLVDLNVPTPPAWGGSSPLSAGFNILPQCLQYRITDTNNVSFSSESTIGCANDFSLTQLERIDINLSFPTGVDDYNLVTCTFGGGCPHQDYNADQGPYFTLRFLDANCTDCVLSTNEKFIYGHFDTNEQTIEYSCTGAGCYSSPITLRLGNTLHVSHGGSPLVVSAAVTFTQDISTFYYQDANYNTRKEGFNTYKSNVVVFPT
jgi:hypothetical protein